METEGLTSLALRISSVPIIWGMEMSVRIRCTGCSRIYSSTSSGSVAASAISMLKPNQSIAFFKSSSTNASSSTNTT